MNLTLSLEVLSQKSIGLFSCLVNLTMFSYSSWSLLSRVKVGVSPVCISVYPCVYACVHTLLKNMKISAHSCFVRPVPNNSKLFQLGIQLKVSTACYYKHVEPSVQTHSPRCPFLPSFHHDHDESCHSLDGGNMPSFVLSTLPVLFHLILKNNPLM